MKIKKFPIAIQCWTFRKFTFYESLEKAQELGVKYLEAYPGQKLGLDMPDIHFNHDLNIEQIELVKNWLKKYDIKVVNYGVVGFENTEESMRKVFDFAKIMGITTIVTEPQFDDYTLIEKMVKEYNINIAIHNHPQPSKYALPETVLEHVKGLDSRIGSCADNGHWMRSGRIPVEALRLLTGRILAFHIKDRSDFGVDNVVDVPIGQGKANIRDILAELTLQNYTGYLSIEYENKAEADNPMPALKKSIKFIKSIAKYDDLLKFAGKQYSKHGWNHYGPGCFILDSKTGVLKSQGGMGLLWFSKKKYADFSLELDFKCSDVITNSGIFLRVPELPVSNAYIHHSFEVQINDAGEGIHRTGAIYDAKAPNSKASNPTGEWNHFKITFKGNRIQVGLNGKSIVDWEAEPRGKIIDFAKEGYIGLQNHDSHAPVYFRNIIIEEL